MKKLLMTVAALGFASQAFAATVTASGTNAVQYTDNTAITGALTTQVWDSFGSPPFNRQIGSGNALPVTITATVPAGTHVFTVVQCDPSGACSAPSNAVTVIVTPPVPKAVTNLTVTVGP